MTKNFLLVSILLLAGSSIFSQPICDPLKTRIVISGVLQWQDPNVSRFSDVNRKDQELNDLFTTLGMPDSATTLLLDQQATLERMNKAIKRQMKACTSESTFIFYYAGHGSKIDNSYYFCNYDMGKQVSTWFDVNSLYDLAAENFKGKRIILLADCCYSGSLLAVGEKIAGLGKEVIVLTSASASNISTGNWTYTQTLLDNLRGDPFADSNKDGKISLNETAFEIKSAMKYREYQLNGFASYGLNADDVIISPAQEITSSTGSKQSINIGEYVYTTNAKGEWKSARVMAASGTTYSCQFYNYSTKQDVERTANTVRKVYFPVYKTGDKIEVNWEGKYYPAEIVKTDDAFMYIHYTGYDNSYDEWVMYDRVKTGKEIACSIEWGGSWYPGLVLEKNETESFVTYTGYSHTWDEWVSNDRVK
ncbi:MAG: caspase family protein [Crocinitomicaceae bacterium]|nr:caspase family protein [Crocinitomicaceae bacterium]MBK9592063.1 caspase family protein [Crocinitomicaceae bacterium]